MTLSKRKLQAILWLPAVGCGVFFMMQLLPVRGLIGHDYYLAFAELIFGKLHFWQHPLLVPHFNPWQCGGIPFFADVQSTYYSLPQFFSFFLPLFSSVLLSYGIFLALGYGGSYLLLRRVFQYGPFSSHLGSLLFLLNGFLFAHLWVGHLTHHSFSLFPGLLYFWLRFKRSQRQVWIDALFFSLGISYLFWSGAAHLLVLFLGLGLFLLPWWWQRSTPAHALRFLGCCLLFILCFVSAKLVPGLLYLKHAHAQNLLSTPDPSLRALFRYFWYWPDTPPYLPFGFIRAGAWEYMGFLSKLSLFLLPLGLVFWWQQTKGSERGWILYYLFATLCVLALATGRLQQYLPWLSAYHNPIKLFAILIWPMIFLSCYALDQLEKSTFLSRLPLYTQTLCFLLVAAILYTEFSYSVRFFRDHSLGISFNPDTAEEISRNFRRLPPVSTIVDQPGADIEALAIGLSSIKCYEPLFGYRAEGVHTQLTPGKVTEIRKGAFNMNHPGCFLYPGFYGCKAWDRVPQNQRLQLAQFRRGRNPWPVPLWQNALFLLSFLSMGAAAFVCAVHIGRRVRSRYH